MLAYILADFDPECAESLEDLLYGVDVERTIDDIEQLQEMSETPDIRPLSASDISAANRRHDEKLAHSPWFQLWQRYGLCCRTESPVFRWAKVKLARSSSAYNIHRGNGLAQIRPFCTSFGFRSLLLVLGRRSRDPCQRAADAKWRTNYRLQSPR
jgi:hypothetical protein